MPDRSFAIRNFFYLCLLRLAFFPHEFRIQPRRILVWPGRDFSQAPKEWEVGYVE